MEWTLKRLRPRSKSVSYSEKYKISSPKTPTRTKIQKYFDKNNSKILIRKKPIVNEKILTKETILKAIAEVNSSLLLDDLVEKMLIEMTENFVESVINGASLIAKHRKEKTVELKDIQLYLRCYNNEKNYLPNHQFKPTEAHKLRMALINKVLKHC